MRPVSERFLRALRGTHHAIIEARVVTPGQTGTDPTGTNIPILDGDVRLDATANIRSTLSITTDGAGMWPTATNGLLTPYGNEIFVRRGINFGGGSTELVSLGYHRINSPEQDDAPDGPITLTCKDRMAGIVDGRLVTPIQFPADETYGDVLAHLVSEVYPWADIEWDDATYTEEIGRQVVAEEDRYKFLDDLIKSVGKIWYWDHRGVLVVKTAPDSGSPVFDVDTGKNGVLVALSRTLTRERVYNAVVASGEGTSTDEPIRAVAIDNNPASATYWFGDFGKVPRFYNSPLITSPAQAASAANAMLRQSLGLPYTADFTAIPNPALEPHDPVRVRYPQRSELHVIETLTIPLTVEQAMPATTRERTLVILGEA